MDFGARGFDTRVARFITKDPLAGNFPYQSPYVFAGNSPIAYIDYQGLFKMSPEDAKKYPMLYNFIYDQENGIYSMLNNADMVKLLTEYGHTTIEVLREEFTPGQGPSVIPFLFKNKNGEVDDNTFGQNINDEWAGRPVAERTALYFCEKLNCAMTTEQQLALLTCIFSSIAHEITHHNINLFTNYDKDGAEWERYNKSLDHNFNIDFSEYYRSANYLGRYNFSLHHLEELQRNGRAPLRLPTYKDRSNKSSNNGSNEDKKEHHNLGRNDRGKRGKDGNYH